MACSSVYRISPKTGRLIRRYVWMWRIKTSLIEPDGSGNPDTDENLDNSPLDEGKSNINLALRALSQR